LIAQIDNRGGSIGASVRRYWQRQRSGQRDLQILNFDDGSSALNNHGNATINVNAVNLSTGFPVRTIDTKWRQHYWKRQSDL
jgi:hypothetical protein